MNFYSTNNYNHKVKLRDAVLRGLAPTAASICRSAYPNFREHFSTT